MQRENSALRSPILEAIVLAATFLAVHALVLRYIFPGFYDPFWPHHSDYYIAQALAHSEGGIPQILSQPRPLALLLFSVFGRLGIQGAVVGSFAVVVANFVGIAMLMRRATGMAFSPAFVAAAASFAYLLASHPYQYEFSTWDMFSQLSFLLLLLATSLKVQGHPAWQVFLMALTGFLVKETYAASAAVLAFAWLLYHVKSDGRRAAVPLAIVLGAFFVAFAINRLNGSPFTGGADFAGSPYQIVLRPDSILAQWWQYAMEGISLASAAVIVMSVAVIALAFGAMSAVTATALALTVAGAMAWLPNSVLPNHHHSAYAWNGAYLLYAPVVLLAAVFRRGAPGIRFLVAAILAAAIYSPSCFTGVYAKERWIVDNQLRQQRLVTALQDLVGRLPSGPTSIVVSGLNGPFSPFDHWQALLAFHPPAGAHFYVMRYPEVRPSGGPSVSAIEGINAEHGLVSWINPDQLESIAANRAWLFRSDGSLAQAIEGLSSVSGAPEFGASGLDLIRYPDLVDIVSSTKATDAEDAAGFRFLKCGTIFLSYKAPDRAEFCLRRSVELIPENPYSHYYLGRALEDLGRAGEARSEYAAAIEHAATSPNPAFNQALDALQRADKS